MPSDDLATLGEELAAFSRRITELRTARGLPADQLGPAFDAALVELDEAMGRLWPLYQALAERVPGKDGGEHGGRDTQTLRAVFQEFPLPVVLLDRDTVVRRLNRSATELIGVKHGYATGRPLTGFVAPPYRAAFRSHVSAVARSGEPRSILIQATPSTGTDDKLQVTLVALRPPGEPRTTVLATVQTAGRLPMVRPPARLESPPSKPSGKQRVDTLRETVHLDLMDAMTTALLDSDHVDPVRALRGAAGVLRGKIADWVVGDLLDEAGARRHVVLGPEGPHAEKLATSLAKQLPYDCPLVVSTLRSATINVQVSPENLGAFGCDEEGRALLARAGITSLVCLPLCSVPPDETDSARPVRGVLSLFRGEGREPFALAEVSVLDRLSRHMALRLKQIHAGSGKLRP